MKECSKNSIDISSSVSWNTLQILEFFIKYISKVFFEIETCISINVKCNTM